MGKSKCRNSRLLSSLSRHRSSSILRELTDYAVEYINQLQTYEHHEFQSLIKLAEKLPAKEHKLIKSKLREMAYDCVTSDPKEWETYCLTPIQVVQSPCSGFYDLFAEIIPINLEYLLLNQKEDGYWDPTWTWGRFEKEWETAKEEWRGILTLDYLKVLNAFDFLEK
ncbi:hypothetical protein [Anaerobacillus sp. CMMVII]|uniref:hypothetical protein n=1 Tax=Anaerobacillus sp. CMMVII TaxID=2755588 RepID=UPI0021B73081|nr:hypothetical protein [Anaerobacillus sp. CMMVII]